METVGLVIIAVIINLIILVAVIRTAVKQAISEQTFRKQSLMRIQYKQTMLLTAIAKRVGVEEHTVTGMINDQRPK